MVLWMSCVLMIMTKEKEARKVYLMYAFETFISEDRECFITKLYAISCRYITKTGFKENFTMLNHNHKTRAESVLRMCCKGWAIHITALTIPNPKYDHVSDFEWCHFMSASFSSSLLADTFGRFSGTLGTILFARVYSYFINIRTMLIVGYCEK